jgi:universal stress protein A
MKVKPARDPGEVLFEVNRRDELLMKAMTSAPLRLKKILVPIDFSDCSKKALQYAFALGQQQNATLTLLYVVPPFSYGGGGEYGPIDYTSLEADMRSSAKNELAALSRKELGDKVGAENVVRFGAPTMGIVDLAKSLPADMIVISTHGRTGLKHVLMGSVAEYVVRHAPCPVLVVRPEERECLASEPRDERTASSYDTKIHN